MKIIRLGSREGRKEFRALQLVKRIRHPNLVPIFGFWLKGADGMVLDDAAIDTAGGMAEASGSPTKTMAVPDVPAPDVPQELVIAMGLGDKSLFDRLDECRQEGLPGIPQEELWATSRTAPRPSTSSTVRFTSWRRVGPPFNTATSSRITS